MGVWKRKQPTKAEAIFLGVMALLFLITTAWPVLAEGRPATVFFWVAVVLDLAILVVSAWLYRRAAKNPPTHDQLSP